MSRTNEAATGATVAAGQSAPIGATGQLHFTPLGDPRQDPRVIRLQQMAAAARARGDEAGFFQHRRDMLNLQAELLQKGKGK